MTARWVLVVILIAMTARGGSSLHPMESLEFTLDGTFLMTFNEGRGARDHFGLNHGTLVSAPVYTNGIVGGAYYFDTDSYITCSDSPRMKIDSTEKFSVSFWFNTDVSDETRYMVSRDDNAASAFDWYVRSQSNDKVAVIAEKEGTATVTCTQTDTYSLNTWYHVVATYNDSTVRLYIDGIFNATGTGSLLATGSPTADFMIGRVEWTEDGKFSGAIDEVIFFKRIISDRLIKRLYQKGALGRK